jgi:hypothetical protein
MIDTDSIKPTAAPRKDIKMTFVITTRLREAKYCDYYVYAIPSGKGKKLSDEYLIGGSLDINIVNGQSEFTKLWNGMNTSREFLPPDSYNIYLYYKIKSASDEVLKKEGRYWGIPDKNVVILK